MTLRSARIAAFAVLLAGAAAAQAPKPAAASPVPAGSFLTFDQMRKAMETSPTHYVYGSVTELGGRTPADFVQELWPAMKDEPQALKVETGPDGKKRVVERTCSDQAEKELEAADGLYYGGQRERALAGYQRAARIDPSCTDAAQGGAECLLKLGRTAEAVDLYRKAVALQPTDHRLRFFLGSALFAAGKPDEATDQMVESLVLHPRFDFALTMLRARADALGVTIHDEPFAPKAIARLEDRGVAIYAPVGDPSAFAWTAWATCKGFWMGEESHRRALTGQARRAFSTVEELECLGALVAAYQQDRAAGTVPADPALDRIATIVKDGYASEMVAYEMASRIVPWGTLLLDESQKQRMREYVKRYVVVKR